MDPEILYTEDNIPIETIYVRDISSKVTEKELKEYFEEFGNVASISVNRIGPKDDSYFYALVTFTKPQSATEVLHCERHWICDECSKVRAADSWNQPKFDEFYKDPTENYSSKDEETNENENQCPILNLNDDCLLRIASFLKLWDLLRMSKTCKRLEYVSNITFASYKSVDTNSINYLTLKGLGEVFAKIGPSLQQINFSALTSAAGRRVVQLLLKYCSSEKLLELTLEEIWIDGFVYKEIIRKFKKLKTLKLEHCDLPGDVCTGLYNCPDLETLDLSGNYKITGKHLDKLPNLQRLNLGLCRSIQPNFFNALCMQRKLVSLNIKFCEKLNYSAFETLANTQVELEDLTIGNIYESPNLLPLTTLKSLKRLSIGCHCDVGDNFFQELARHRGAELEMLTIDHINLNWNIKQALYEFKNLKELSIPRCRGIDSLFLARMAKSAPLEYFSSARCSSVDNDGILDLIRLSGTIKRIDVSSCEQINPELVRRAVNILMTKNINTPLTLLAGDTNIYGDFMVNMIMLHNPQLIKLEFDLTD